MLDARFLPTLNRFRVSSFEQSRSNWFASDDFFAAAAMKSRRSIEDSYASSFSDAFEMRSITNSAVPISL